MTYEQRAAGSKERAQRIPGRRVFSIRMARGQALRREGVGVLEELQGCPWSWRFREGKGVVGKEAREMQIVWDPSKDLLAW